MKKIFSILILSIIAIACSTDADNNDLDDGIVGTWTAVSLSGATSVDLNGDGTASSNILEELPCFESSIVFAADGNYSATTSDIAFTGTNLFDIMADCDGTTIETGTYTFNGNSLSIDPVDDEPSTVNTTLEGDTLTIQEIDEDLGPVTLVLQRN